MCFHASGNVVPLIHVPMCSSPSINSGHWLTPDGHSPHVTMCCWENFVLSGSTVDPPGAGVWLPTIHLRYSFPFVDFVSFPVTNCDHKKNYMFSLSPECLLRNHRIQGQGSRRPLRWEQNTAHFSLKLCKIRLPGVDWDLCEIIKLRLAPERCTRLWWESLYPLGNGADV